MTLRQLILMNHTNKKLLIISRDALLDKLQEASSDHVFRALASLSRRGFHLLLTAPEPDRWVPTRRSVDEALNAQRTLLERSRTAGVEFEGVYYVPRSLLTQDRNREGALRDILKRFSVEPGGAILISSSSPFLKAAARVGIATSEIALKGKRRKKLLSVLNEMIKRGNDQAGK